MKPFPPLLVLAVMIIVVLGVPLGLYALLTKERRCTMRMIRTAASERGWRYRVRHWQGNPSAFRIDGRTPSGLSWIMTSGSTNGYDHGWNVELAFRISILGGEVDLVILPRDSKSQVSAPDATAALHWLSPSLEPNIAAFSGTAASAIRFFRDAQEFPSGYPPFDARYRVLTVDGAGQSIVDTRLAGSILHWPADAIAPHSMLAWCDPFGFHCRARLPATPNLATVLYFATLAEEFTTRIPAAEMPAGPQGLVDRIAGRFLR